MNNYKYNKYKNKYMNYKYQLGGAIPGEFDEVQNLDEIIKQLTEQQAILSRLNSTPPILNDTDFNDKIKEENYEKSIINTKDIIKYINLLKDQIENLSLLKRRLQLSTEPSESQSINNNINNINCFIEYIKIIINNKKIIEKLQNELYIIKLANDDTKKMEEYIKRDDITDIEHYIQYIELCINKYKYHMKMLKIKMNKENKLAVISGLKEELKIGKQAIEDYNKKTQTEKDKPYIKQVIRLTNEANISTTQNIELHETKLLNSEAEFEAEITKGKQLLISIISNISIHMLKFKYKKQISQDLIEIYTSYKPKIERLHDLNVIIKKKMSLSDYMDLKEELEEKEEIEIKIKQIFIQKNEELLEKIKSDSRTLKNPINEDIESLKLKIEKNNILLSKLYVMMTTPDYIAGVIAKEELNIINLDKIIDYYNMSDTAFKKI